MLRKNTQGVTVVEILIGVTLFSVIVVFITHTLTLYFTTADLLQEKTKALYLAQEGQEILRYIRDEDWGEIADLAIDTTYYFDVSTSTVATTTVTELLESKYTRSFVVHEAYRDADDDLVASTTAGSSPDAGSRLIITKVKWDADNSVSLESLLTNLHNI